VGWEKGWGRRDLRWAGKRVGGEGI